MSIAVTRGGDGDPRHGHAAHERAAATVDRIVNAFRRQAGARPHDAPTSLRGVISQQLIQRADKPAASPRSSC